MPDKAGSMAKKRVLIHVCCAPCLLHPYMELRDEGFRVTGLFYNPNIHPYTEYKRRIEAVQVLEQTEGIKIIYRDEYDLDGFLRAVAFREASRCPICYHMRLKETVIVARHGKFDFFTSTLLYSKHQDHNAIIGISEALSREYGVKFLYRDFRTGWKNGIERSKILGLYRQGYCGCIYSERDRYLVRMSVNKGKDNK